MRFQHKLTDGRYELLLASVLIDAKNARTGVEFGDNEKAKIPAFAPIMTDRDQMSIIDGALGELLSARRDLRRMNKYLTSQSRIERGEARLELARASVEHMRTAHPAMVAALETYHEAYNTHYMRAPIAQVDRKLTEIQEEKKRKVAAYVEYCHDVGREPTPEPAPAPNKLS